MDHSNLGQYKELTEIIKNIATAFAIILGGGWALWKWQFSEMLRKGESEISIEGLLGVEKYGTLNNHRFVCLTSNWKNRAKHRVELDKESCFIEIFKVKPCDSAEYLNVDIDLGKPIIRAFFFETINKFYLGPNTESRFNEHFYLPINEIFVARWNLVKKQSKDEKWLRTWSKSIVIDLTIEE